MVMGGAGSAAIPVPFPTIVAQTHKEKGQASQ